MQTFRIRADCLDGRGVRPWFLRAVLQGCGTRYRRRHPTLALTALDRWDELPLYEATQAGQPDEEAAEAASRFFAEVAPRDVEASLASLPYEYREVAALYFMAGCSYPELSIVLDLSVDAVRPRLHAARRALQRALRDRARERGLLPAA
jgi:DNA-directed RNA polymerase specialized sigma24 family protein